MATLATLVDRVEYHAERVTPQGETVGLNTSSIEKQLEEAARVMLRKAPLRVVARLAVTGSVALTNKAGPPPYTEIEVPTDWLRHVHVMLADWERPVYELIDSRSNQHRLQVNSQTQADAYNPVLVLDTNGTDVVLRGYPQDSAPDYAHLAYVDEVPPDGMPEVLIDPMVLRAASRVVQSSMEAGHEPLANRAQRRLAAIKTGERPMRTNTDDQPDS
jgi:hypothetical protein